VCCFFAETSALFLLLVSLAARFLSPMMIERLADIELQLCMHGMQAGERLRWARCSRQLLHAAASPFAWRFVQPLQIQATSLSAPSLTAVNRLKAPLLPIAPSSSFLRHIPLHLQWTDDRAHVLPQSALAGLDALQRAEAQIHSLDTSSCRDVHPSIMRVLLSPVRLSSILSHLRVLRLHEPSSKALAMKGYPGVLELLATHASTHLHTLSIPEALDSATMSALATHLLPALQRNLTSLHLNAGDNWGAGQAAVLESIAQCGSLTHLGLAQPNSIRIEEAFEAFFTSPNMRRLQSLTLRSFSAGGLNPHSGILPNFCAAFRAMDQLHSLDLINTYSVDSMLASLDSAVSLRSLTLRWREEWWTKPSAAVVAGLLTRTSDRLEPLQCSLVLLWAKPSHRPALLVADRQWRLEPALRDARKQRRVTVTMEAETNC
jgi:hypothetical protein